MPGQKDFPLFWHRHPFLCRGESAHRSEFSKPVTAAGRTQGAHTGAPSRKLAYLPDPVVAIGVKYDGGIIVTPEVVAAKVLKYDGGLIGTVYQKDVDAEFAMTYAMTADYSAQFNAQTYLVNW